LLVRRPERLAELLRSPQALGPAYQQLPRFGPSVAAVGGRALVAALDASMLESGPCGTVLAARVLAAFTAAPPVGLKIYRRPLSTPDVRLTVSEVRASPTDPLCGGSAEQHCLSVMVKARFDGGEEGAERIPLSSLPYADCHAIASSDLQELARLAFASFAIEVAGTEASLTSARLIRAGCLDVFSKGERQFRQALQNRPAAAIYLKSETPGPLEGFGQELSAALLPHQELIGVVKRGDEPRDDGLALSWSAQGHLGADVPATIQLTLRWPRSDSPAPAVLTLDARRRDDCNFNALTFQQAAATQGAFWLVRLSSAAPIRTAADKDWSYAPWAVMLAGLPQLMDDDRDNNARGTLLAGTDLALLTASAVFVLLSIEARNDYSAGSGQAALDRANHRLHTAYVLGGLAVVPRLLSVVC